VLCCARSSRLFVEGIGPRDKSSYNRIARLGPDLIKSVQPAHHQLHGPLKLYITAFFQTSLTLFVQIYIIPLHRKTCFFFLYFVGNCKCLKTDQKTLHDHFYQLSLCLSNKNQCHNLFPGYKKKM
jgi:hypothetical protein